MSNEEDSRQSQPESKKSNKIDETIVTLVRFSFGFLSTAWVLFSWPFKRVPEILNEDRPERFLSPYSFLFICTSIQYFASDRLILLLSFIGRQVFEKLTLFPDFSQPDYSLQAFAFNTGPILVIVIAIAHLTGWLLTRRDYIVKQRLQSGIYYLLGYIMLLASLFTFVGLYIVTDIMSHIARPGQDMSTLGKSIVDEGIFRISGGTIAVYSILALGIYGVIEVLMILFSLCQALGQRSGPGMKHVPPLILRLLALSVSILSSCAATVAVTAYSVHSHYSFSPEKQIAAIVVIPSDESTVGRTELPLSMALTNVSHKSIMLFAFIPVRGELRIEGQERGEWGYRFTPTSVPGRFIELKPNTSVVIEGTLSGYSDQRHAWLMDGHRSHKLKMRIDLWGTHPEDGTFDLFEVYVEDRFRDGRWGGLQFANQAQMVLPAAPSPKGVP